MSARRALRWTSHLAVSGWTVALLARASWLVVPQPMVEPPTARVVLVPAPPPEPVVEPEPELPQEPAAAPKPALAAPAPSEPEPRSVSQSDFAAGSGLLDGGGAFPILSFSYEDFPSFTSYARAMASLGARFVVVKNRQIVGAVEVESREVTATPVGAGFSPRARDYTGEPGLAPLSRAARQRFGGGSVVMMLVPRALDAGLYGGLARLLKERGEPHPGLAEIRGRYEKAPGGGVRLRVEQALRRDGTSVPVDALFDLGQLLEVAS